MKKINIKAAAIFIFCTAVFFSSCNNPCRKLNCLNGGFCVEGGKCFCPDGYEGIECETRETEKFTGTYTVQENCTSTGAHNYNCSILQSTTDFTTLTLSDLHEFFTSYGILTPVYATVDEDSSKFTLPVQVLSHTSGTVILSGNASRTSGGELNMNYSVSFPSTNNDVCTCTFTPQ